MKNLDMLNLVSIILAILVFCMNSYIVVKQLRDRVILDKKLKTFLMEEITKNQLDVDRIESIVRKNTLTILIEKQVSENEVIEFREKVNSTVNAAIERLAKDEKIIIYRSIQNSSKNNTSKYKNKILLDSIHDLKQA